MALLKSEAALGRKPVASLVNATGGDIRYEYVIGATALAAGDVIYMGDLPAGKAELVDALLISDDLDSNAAPTITLSMGILTSDKTAIGAGPFDTWITASNVAQTGGVARPTTANVSLSGPQEFILRPIGIVVGAGAATAAMTGKKLVIVVRAVG